MVIQPLPDVFSGSVNVPVALHGRLEDELRFEFTLRMRRI